MYFLISVVAICTIVTGTNLVLMLDWHYVCVVVLNYCLLIMICLSINYYFLCYCDNQLEGNK